jgi:hypothetical protein
MDNIAAGKEVLLHDGGDCELKLAQRVKEEGMRKEGGLAPSAPPASRPGSAPAPPAQREEEAAAAWPVAVSGIEAGGVAVPAPVVQRDDPPR